MKIKTLVRIIIVLLIILIASLVLTLILLDKRDASGGADTTKADPPAVESESDEPATEPSATLPEATEPTEPTDSDPSVTTPSGSEPSQSTPAETKPSETKPSETKPSETKPSETKPAETDPSTPSTPAPGDYAFERSFSSDTGTRLNIHVVCQGTALSDGTVRVTASLYLDYYSLGLGGRNGCRLTLGDKTATFSSPAISEEENHAHSQLIGQVETVCKYGETLSLYARFPFRGTYSDVEIENMEINETLVIR